MQCYEFTVLPAPARLRRHSADGAEAGFSLALCEIMNEMGQSGWDFAGAERLPCRVGLWPFAWRRARHVLVFRRPRKTHADGTAGQPGPQPSTACPDGDLVEGAALEMTAPPVRPRRVAAATGPRPVRRLRPRLTLVGNEDGDGRG
ncbi:hypothetical protein BYZ73_16135 [Rhodovulum viride]|uniref:DUF4177 domain-containing protein n=1 Tax=Rhodovulum viride TaxID=1231134 RepID=A0ABX9DDC6_9RHOB|nr:hypothetical protein [Rhodovulum viride]RAP40336.1 hypothetical protein BYZ73_16135 [Rhodovulum viride]